MTNFRQFWAIFKFQATLNPALWFMPIALGAPLFFSHSIFPASYHPNLFSLLTIQNLFFVGIIGLIALAPEMNQAWGTGSGQNSSTEFLLTRAVDRPIVYRARAAVLYFLILIFPVIGFFQSLKAPDVKITEYSSQVRQQCLRYVPGATLEKDPSGSRSPLISIPRGNVLAEEWHLWMYMISTLSVQLLILLIYPLKGRLIIFYSLFLGFVFGNLFYSLSRIRNDMPSYTESLFFYFSAYPALFWISTASALIVGQLWCERRFCRLDQ